MRIDQILGAVVGGLGSGVKTSNPMVDHYLRYVAAMAEQAFARWTSVSSSGVRCQLGQHTDDGKNVKCTAPAIAGCMVCGAAVCLHHAMVSPKYVMCFVCAEAAVQTMGGEHQRDKGKPFGFVEDDEDTKAEVLRLKYLKVIGLGASATPDEIKAAYKRLALEHHPDRAPANRKAAKQKKMRDINEAYAWLTQQRKAAA